MYISGTGAKAYQTDDDFLKRNIKLEYSNFLEEKGYVLLFKFVCIRLNL